MIEIKDISKHYENASGIKQVVLENIDLSIEQGETIAIVGPSGSGKSTFLNIVGSLDLATSGSVTIDGKNISGFDEKSLSEFRNSEVGFVFQQHHLLPQLTLLENVLLPVLPINNKEYTHEANSRAIELLKNVGLEEKVNQVPSQCSVGECQRAAVVRALINQPKVLLADEPTGSLDEQNALELVNLLSQINQDKNLTLIMVTHSMELAKKMKTVYRLSNKKLEQL